MLLGVFIVSGLVLLYVINQLWANNDGAPTRRGRVKVNQGNSMRYLDQYQSTNHATEPKAIGGCCR